MQNNQEDLLRKGQLPLALRLRDDASLMNFYSEGNEAPFAWLKDFLQKIQNKQEMSIGERVAYFYGLPGTGKTHLLWAACQAVRRSHGIARYLSVQDPGQWLARVEEDWSHCDLLCLDDLHFLEELGHRQEDVFHVFNACFDGGSGILLAGVYPVHSLSIQLLDLRSRISAGVYFKMNPLTDDAQIFALQLRAKQRELRLSYPVGRFLVNRLPRDMKTLSLALNVLDAASLKEQRALTIPFVKKILSL